jgi:hypothetical protein
MKTEKIKADFGCNTDPEAVSGKLLAAFLLYAVCA